MKRKRGEPRPVRRLMLKEIKGNITYGRDRRVTAWFVLPAQQWAFRSDAQRLDLVMNAASHYAVLDGRTLHLRVTTRPYPVRKWVEGLDRNTPEPVGGKATGSAWDTALVCVQQHLAATTLSDKEVYVGVEVHPRSAMSLLVAKALRREVESEADAISEDVRMIETAIAGPGIEGRPATAAEMEWLVRRSVGLGLPAPAVLSPVEGDWRQDDLDAFTDAVDYDTKPLGRTTRVVSGSVERYVAVLALGRMESIEVPSTAHDPWMAHADRLPFPVEWSCTVPIESGQNAATAASRRLLVGRDMEKHYQEHGLDVPLDVGRKIGRARQVVDQMTEGSEVVANRAYGWFRLAVSGRTEKECLARVRQVQEVYRPLRISVEHPKGQQALLREFIPGEPLSTVAYRRRLPVLYFAAGMPTVSSSLGDRRGPYRGYTVGTARRAVMFDPWYPTEIRETSGLIVATGGLGSGKSVLGGAIVYDAVLAGNDVTAWDPGQTLAGLVGLPEFEGRAHSTDLTRADPGTLTPYGVVPEPRRDEFASTDEGTERFEKASAAAAMARKRLALDTCRALLPPQIDAMAETRIVLADAVRVVGGWPTASLWRVVEVLEGHENAHGKVIANYLRDMAEMPLASLCFPEGYSAAREVQTTYGLEVVTMGDLVKPDTSKPREEWTDEEALAMPLLNLAMFDTVRRLGGREERNSARRKRRKMLALDEVHWLADWPSGAALVSRVSRQTRVDNNAVFVASQNGGDVLKMNVANFVSTVFAGRTEDEQVARETLRLLRVQEGVGYERVLAGLSPRDPRSMERSGFREFVMRDVDGNIDKMRVDTAHYPWLLPALNTTADPLGLRTAAA